jgi:TolB-like protein
VIDIAVSLSIVAAAGLAQVATKDPNEAAAFRAVAEATYKQTGAEVEVQKSVHILEKRYLTDDERKYGGWVIIGVRLIEGQTVVWTWTF